jgi:hypothetical protein
MQTNLTKVGGKWAVELVGGDDEEALVLTFEGKEHATNKIRMWNSGQSEIPVLEKKGAAKPKKKSAPKPKATTKAKVKTKPKK